MGGGVGGEVEKGGGEEEGDGEMDCCWVEGVTWGLLDKDKMEEAVEEGQERGGETYCFLLYRDRYL